MAIEGSAAAYLAVESLFKRTIIYGAGWHGRSVAWIQRESGDWIEGFLDDAPIGSPVDGVSIIGDSGKLHDAKFLSQHRFIVGIGNCQYRWQLTERLINCGASLIISRHPSAVDAAETVGVGTVIFPNATIGVGARIGRGCIVNNNATIGHECVLEDGSSVCDGSNLGGGVVIGQETFLGLGVRVLPKVKIGSNCLIGAGAVVTKDVPDNVAVVGVPGKIVKEFVVRKKGEPFEGAEL